MVSPNFGLTFVPCTSVERAKFWAKEIQLHEEGCRVYLCGTKLDLVLQDPKVRQVDVHDMLDYAETVRFRVIVVLEHFLPDTR